EFEVVCTFDAIHDQAHPTTVLENIHRALKPDGVYIVQEIRGHTHVHDNMEHPLAPFIYTVSCMHCMSVSLHQGGACLGRAWGEELCGSLRKAAGFQDITSRKPENDFESTFFSARSGR